MQLFSGGKEMASKDDLDKKVNVDSNLYSEVSASNDISQVIGTTPHTGMRLLKAFRDNSASEITAGNNGSGIAFGGDDTAAVISVDGWGEHIARVTWQNSHNTRLWHEDIAWKSDIQNLNNLLGPVLSSNIKQLGKTDLNNLPSGWCLVTDSTSPNLPAGVSDWCICFTLYVTDTDRFQIAIGYNLTDCNIYVRTCGGSPAQWLQWKKISYSA